MARLVWSAGERFSGAPVAEMVRRHARQAAARGACRWPWPAWRHARATARWWRSPLAMPVLAVQASSAIEGQFTPVRIHGEQYIDADWLAPLPVRLARSLGAHACSPSTPRRTKTVRRRVPSVYRVSDLRKRALVQADAVRADLLLHPDFGYWVSFSREFRERAIAAGYRDTHGAGRALCASCTADGPARAANRGATCAAAPPAARRASPAASWRRAWPPILPSVRGPSCSAALGTPGA